MLATAELEAELAATAGVLAAALFTVPMAIGLAVEPVVLAASARWDRRRVLAGGLAGMGLVQLGIAGAHDVRLLSALVTLWGIGAGLATRLAEVALVARAASTERAMARWTLAGALGDVAAPLALATAAGASLGWRTALAAVAVVALANAVAIATGPPLAGDDEDDDVPLRDALRAEARNPRLWAWLLAAAACTLLDEVFVSFGALWLDARGHGLAEQARVFVAFSAGGAVGTATVERLATRSSPRTLLLACSAACAASFVAWMAFPLPAAFVLGASALPLWTLSTSQAYRAGTAPGRVAALGAVLAPLEIAAPLLLGAVADRWGIGAAMALLLLQPAIVAITAARDR
ncbi:MAG: MFS transporter [Myxococcota bacterium]